MRITLTWLRIDSRRRWRSLLVLALLVALATATVLAAAAGARRGQSVVDRLWTGTLPATVTVLPNQPGFDWAKVRALPEVAAVSEFPVTFGYQVACCPDAGTGFPPIGDDLGRTIERPFMLAGRMFDPARTRIAAMRSGLTSCAITNRRIASIVGWPNTPHGYGLIETPG